MWRSKKFIVIAVLTMLVLAGTIGGVAIAQANDDENTPPESGNISLLDKVAEVYEKNTGVAINTQELQKAFVEAGQAIRDEAQDRFLQKLVTDDKITQEQADQFKAWLDSRPALPTDEFKAWMEARPDIPALFGKGNDGRMGPFGGMNRGMMGKFGGGFGGRFGAWCAPDANED